MNSKLFKLINIYGICLIGVGIYGVMPPLTHAMDEEKKDSSQASHHSAHEASSSIATSYSASSSSSSSSSSSRSSQSSKPQNPPPFKSPSEYLQSLKDRLIAEQKAKHKNTKDEAKTEKDHIDEDYKNAREDRLEKHLPDDLVKLCGHYLDPASACEGISIKNLEKLQHESDRLFLNELDRQFVKIPAGHLPAPTIGAAKIPVAAFETTHYPVTRAFWKEVMGARPKNVPTRRREAWDQCPDCPVTHVAYEEYVRDEHGNHVKGSDGKDQIRPAEIQTFLEKLNKRVEGTGCTYHLPSFDQLRYSIRADVTGENQDKYSTGVTDQNVNEYVTHANNSKKRTQPVGQKTLNAFGIELGNVSKMSLDPYDQNDPSSGRAMSCGGWSRAVSDAASAMRCYAGIRRHQPDTGFVLVRECK